MITNEIIIDKTNFMALVDKNETVDQNLIKSIIILNL